MHSVLALSRSGIHKSGRILDLDTVPKTKRLNNQVATGRPKIPHNPPSRVRTVAVSFSVCLSNT